MRGNCYRRRRTSTSPRWCLTTGTMTIGKLQKETLLSTASTTTVATRLAKAESIWIAVRWTSPMPSTRAEQVTTAYWWTIKTSSIERVMCHRWYPTKSTRISMAEMGKLDRRILISPDTIDIYMMGILTKITHLILIFNVICMYSIIPV